MSEDSMEHLPDDPSAERDAPRGAAWHSAHRMLLLVGAAAILFWLGSGFYRVGINEVAIVERLGDYVRNPNGSVAPVGPGVHYGLPWPFDRVEKIGIDQTRRMDLDSFDVPPGAMTAAKRAAAVKNVSPELINAQYDPYLISSDENVFHATAAISYRIHDAAAWVQAAAPVDKADAGAKRDEMIRHVIERELVNAASGFKVEMFIPVNGAVDQYLTKRLQAAMVDENGASRYGLVIDSVHLTDSRPPAYIKRAFEEVPKAEAAMQGLQDDATKDATANIAEATARAKAITDGASINKAAMIAAAEGERSRFEAFYMSYERNRDVARYDLWQTTINDVLQQATRVYFVSPDQTVVIPLAKPEKTLDIGAGGR